MTTTPATETTEIRALADAELDSVNGGAAPLMINPIVVVLALLAALAR